MKKKILPWIVIDLVFLIVFNVVFFALCGTDNTASAWISYAFIHIAYLLLLITPKFIPKTDDPDSYAYSLYSISGIHFIITLICGIVFICIKDNIPQYAICAHAVITGIYIIAFIAHMMVGKKANDSYQQSEKEIKYINTCCAKLEILKNKLKDNNELYLKVNEVYEAVHASPVKTHGAVHEIEINMLKAIEALSENSLQENKESFIAKANEIIGLVNERNTLLKYNN